MEMSLTRKSNPVWFDTANVIRGFSDMDYNIFSPGIFSKRKWNC